ncbi:uncharacterized protein LOC141714892 [Apium graveolens]|uniref:uncharacterized protein LOC141714892 n=1 Tax=Apium graveolens TaxID=4045 RepID=UPI003D7B20E3
MTKWVEAKSMRTINQQNCIKFMDSIVMRFGISVVLISDNGIQFVGSDFEAYLKELGIKHKRESVAHPYGNEQDHPQAGTRETPFKLAYGTEEWLLVETGSPSHRVVNFDEVSNIEGLKTNMELFDELRDWAWKRWKATRKKRSSILQKKPKSGNMEWGIWYSEIPKLQTQQIKANFSPTGKGLKN